MIYIFKIRHEWLFYDFQIQGTQERLYAVDGGRAHTLKTQALVYDGKHWESISHGNMS